VKKVFALIHQLAREYWFYETLFPISYIGYYFLEDRWLKNYVHIPTVTVSESTKKDLLDLGFKRVFIVPVGINSTSLSGVLEKEEHPVVAYVGRLKRAKRPDHAIRAFKIIKEKLPNAELWIIGEGPFCKDLKKMVTPEGGVKFFGNMLDEERRRGIGFGLIGGVG
jgi:glycosyltransferase involved in cell wall biosynthesis